VALLRKGWLLDKEVSEFLEFELAGSADIEFYKQFLNKNIHFLLC